MIRVQRKRNVINISDHDHESLHLSRSFRPMATHLSIWLARHCASFITRVWTDLLSRRCCSTVRHLRLPRNRPSLQQRLDNRTVQRRIVKQVQWRASQMKSCVAIGLKGRNTCIRSDSWSEILMEACCDHSGKGLCATYVPRLLRYLAAISKST